MTQANHRTPRPARRSWPGFWPIMLLRSRCWSSWWAWRWPSPTAVTAVPLTGGAARTLGCAGRLTPRLARSRRSPHRRGPPPHRRGPPPHRPVMLPGGPCTPMTTPAGPGRPGRTRCTPTTPAGPGARTRTHAGPLPKRRCERTATPAGPQRTRRPGAMPHHRLTTASPAGPAVAVPSRDGNHRPRLVARRSGLPREQCRRRYRCRSGPTSVPRPTSIPGPPLRGQA